MQKNNNSIKFSNISDVPNTDTFDLVAESTRRAIDDLEQRQNYRSK